MEKTKLRNRQNNILISRTMLINEILGMKLRLLKRNLIDANGQTIEPDGDGIYHIYEGEAYRWSINLYAPAGLPEAGTYEYPLPDGH